MARAKAIEADTCTYTVVFEPDEQGGGYTVTCPALPGLVTEGDTLEEARAMAADAIRCYLASLRQDGLPLPLGEVHDAEPMSRSNGGFRRAVVLIGAKPLTTGRCSPRRRGP